MKYIALNSDGCDLLKEIIKDLKMSEKSDICPNWSSFLIDPNDELYILKDCEICIKLFHKAISNICPCNLYSSTFLIKRLNEIIRYSERGIYEQT